MSLIATAALFAFWPRFIDLDDLPDDPLAGHYRTEALSTIAYMRDNPFQRMVDPFVIQQWRFSHWREVPGSGEGSTSLPSLMDVRVDATALGPWGVPVASYTIGCGGACAQIAR